MLSCCIFCSSGSLQILIAVWAMPDIMLEGALLQRPAGGGLQRYSWPRRSPRTTTKSRAGGFLGTPCPPPIAQTHIASQGLHLCRACFRGWRLEALRSDLLRPCHGEHSQLGTAYGERAVEDAGELLRGRFSAGISRVFGSQFATRDPSSCVGLAFLCMLVVSSAPELDYRPVS
jgi:hypothetical protein